MSGAADESSEPDVAQAFARGTVTFMGLELLVGVGALVPRPETELLGQEVVRLLTAGGGAALVIDMCCGAGNLACAIAHEVPSATVWASDLLPGAVDLARRNSQRLGLAERMRVFQGDLFEPLRGDLGTAKADFVVCNPPYISTAKLETARRALLDHEPREAFDGGPYGLAIHQRVIREAIDLLKPGGLLGFEFGLGQERQMKALFDRSRAYGLLRFLENASGAPRAVVATRT
jgi:release factor glutamine methyltransferase